MNRTRSSIRNVTVTMVGAIVTMLLQFVNRRVFVNFLSGEYLGLNGLFADILSMLSLSELGVEGAMIYALYKPVAEKDIEKVKSLMKLYKTLYRAIGCFILCVGFALTPFLHIFIKEMPDIPYIQVYYLMYIIDCGMSYFYSYKRSLIICNREDYISATTTTCSAMGMRLAQLIVLIFTHNYFLFLASQVVFNRIENIVISKIAEKRYPYLLDKNVERLDRTTTTGIKKNIFAMMSHKIGTVVVYGTDNIIISKILGLKILGIYSNYSLLISTVNGIINKVFSAITSNIGNLVAEKDKSEVERVFYNIFFANFWIYSVCTICFFCLLQPFVGLWLGSEFLLSDITVWILALGFYFTGMRRSCLAFRDATGVFYYDRYKALVEAILNIAVSIPLTIRYGVVGVKLGTVISMLLTSFWIEGYVFFNKYLNKSITKYMLKQAQYALVTIGICFLTNQVCIYIDKGNLFSFVIECVICFMFSNVLLLLFFFRTKEFGYFWKILRGVFIRNKSRT